MADPAAYQVVARRYRPQRFTELVGQEHVARGLAGAIESGRIGHAYLFTGARGVGKTSAARIYAKALECTDRQNGEPCNNCPRCQAIASGQDVDVIEVDAASNRGIDEIRQLRQNVAVRPAGGNYKTYIIDEVHMLTREAFNALLKTLEEPPSHVKFVLCTTEPEKLPITILSRCQRFDFQSVDAAAITRRLAQIVEAEGVTASPEALGMIARRAAGSMRDSQSLLEQLLGLAADESTEIGADDVQAVIGIGSEEKIGQLIHAVISRDAQKALAALDDALAGGADAGGVLEQLLAALRDCLVASVGCGPEALLAGDGYGIDLGETGRTAGTQNLLAMLQIIDQGLARMRQSTHATVLAEMVVVRLASLENLDDLNDVINQLADDHSSQQAAAPEKKKGARGALVTPPAEPPLPSVTADQPDTTSAPSQPASMKNAGVSGTVPAMPTASRPFPEPLPTWKLAGEAVGGLAVDFAAMAVSAAWDDHLLRVEMPATGGAAVAFLGRPEIVSKFQQALSERVGQACRYAVTCRTADPTSKAAPEKQTRQTSSPERGRARGVSSAALLREAMEHPLVSHARTIFDAAIRKVEPPRRKPPSPPDTNGKATPPDAQGTT